MSRIADVAPQAEVIDQPWGHTVYGWTQALHLDTRPEALPLKVMISIHAWRWTAHRARKRWLQQQPPTTATQTEIALARARHARSLAPDSMRDDGQPRS